MPRMTFELSEDHESFRRVVRDFAEKEIAPHAAQWDRDHHFPVDVVASMGQLGLFGLVEMFVFIGTVFLAYAYVWRRGGLEWD